MNPIVAEHWNKEKHELPGFDCILYANGNVTVLNCFSMQNSQTKERRLFCHPRCDTTMDSLEKYAAAEWTSVDEWVRIEREGEIFIGGDGIMGNMGFIARVDSDDDLIWGVFFWNSNPIKKLEINGDVLSAINEHSDLCIEINLENLAEMTMTLLSKASVG